MVQLKQLDGDGALDRGIEALVDNAHPRGKIRRGFRTDPDGSGQLDGGLGLALARDSWDRQLTWISGGRSGVYPVAYGPVREVLVLSAAYGF